MPVSLPAASGAAARRRPSQLAIARRRQLWPFLLGNLASNSGSWFQTMAQTILVYRLTGSTLLVGVVNFAQFAAVLLLSPWAGAAADRFDRRRIIVLTQAAAIAVSTLLALLTWLGVISAPLVVLLVLVLGLVNAFASPAIGALVPLLVEREELPAAFALISLTYQFARAGGPIVGVAVVSTLGVGGAFGLNALSYLALIVGVAVVRPKPQERSRPGPSSLQRSLQLIRSDVSFAALLLTLAAITLTADPVLTLGPAFVSRIFGQPDTYSGFLLGAFGVGSAVGALGLVGRFPVTWGAIAITTGLTGASIVAFGLSGSLAMALPILALAGAAFLTTNITIQTQLQQGVDETQRGQAMALWVAAFIGTRPLGSLVDGAIASTFGLRAAAVAMGAPALLAALLAWRLWRRGRAPL